MVSEFDSGAATVPGTPSSCWFARTLSSGLLRLIDPDVEHVDVAAGRARNLPDGERGIGHMLGLDEKWPVPPPVHAIVADTGQPADRLVVDEVFELVVAVDVVDPAQEDDRFARRDVLDLVLGVTAHLGASDVFHHGL